MKPYRPSRFSRSNSTRRLKYADLFLTFAISGLSLIVAGCGTNMSQGPPVPHGNTNVTILLTSTANDQLVAFNIRIMRVSLTNASGNSVTLFQASNPPITFVDNTEFIHLNGAVEPLAASSIPQDTYVSATVAVARCSFRKIFSPSFLSLSNLSYGEDTCDQGTGNSTVNLASPITVSGTGMNLILNLQVAQSYTLDTTTTPATFTISPVFTLAPAFISAQPANYLDGKVSGLEAQIASVGSDGKSLVVQTAEGTLLTIETGAATTYQGTSGFSSLIKSQFVNLDLAFQPDDSLLATRLELDDSNSPLVNAGAALFGPRLFNSQMQYQNQPVLELGCVVGVIPECTNQFFEYTAPPRFNVSGEFSNLQSLPFTPEFDGTRLFPGQSVAVFFSFVRGQAPIVNTYVVVPQTINGTVAAMTTSNGFAVYTVTLAPYDIFSVLQMHPTLFEQTPPLTNPSSVFVYADTNTQMLTSGLVDVGSVVRFRGLIFDDNGTLRMDCSEILDGVPE